MTPSGIIQEILSTKPDAIVSVGPDTTVYDTIKVMADRNIGAVLVMDGDTLAGILSERDYTRKVILEGKSSKTTKVSEIMADKPVTVKPDSRVDECLKIMTDKRVRHLPVVQGKKVVGLVSIGDLVKFVISAQDAAINQLENYIAGGY